MIKSFQVALTFQNQFLRIRDKFCFSRQASFIIIAFHQFQILSFILSKEIVNELLQLQGSDTLDFLVQIFSYFRIYTFFAQQDSCNEAILTMIMFVLMFLYIVLLLVIVYKRQQENENLQSRMINILEEIVSFAFKLYYFIFHWSITLSVLVLIKRKFQLEDLNLCSQIGFFFSIPTLLLSFLLLVNILMFSFTYHFKSYDYLYGEDNYLKLYQVLLIYIILIFYVFVNNEIVIWIGLFSTMFNIFAQHYYIQFRDQFISNWNRILQSETISLLIILILIKLFDLIEYFNAIFIMTLPLTYALQMKLIQKEDQTFYLMKKNNLISNHLDKMLRQIYYRKINLKTNKNAFYNIQLYSIMTNHLSNCKLENAKISYKKSLSHQLCFCLKYFPNQNENENPHWKRLIKQHSNGSLIQNDKYTISDEKEFRKFIFDFIKSQYESSIDPKSKELYFSYITFLFEVLNQPTKGFYEALKLKLSSTGFKSNAITSDLINKSRIKFNLLIQKEELKNQKFDMIRVLKFESELKQRENDLLNLVTKYQQWYSILVSQSVNLNRLQILGTKTLQEIFDLEIKIHKMFEINPNSSALNQIIKVFYKFIHFNQPKPEFLKRKNLNLYKYNQSLLKELFDPQSFIIQITLMQPRGTIINCSKDLYKFTGLQDKEILNQNIKMVIPDIIAQYHDQYLDTFVETGRMNVVKADNRILYIKNKDMFIVPVTAKVRIENYSNNDFGASALLNKINTQYFYLMLNKFGMLEEFCEKIYKHILQKYLNMHQKQLKGLDLLKIMPNLYSLWDQLINNDFQDQIYQIQQNILNDLQDDFIVLPRDTNDITVLFENRRSQRFIQLTTNYKSQRSQMKSYLEHCIGEPTIYEIKYKIKIIHAINQNIIVLEIQHLKPVKQKQLSTVMNRILKMIDIEISSPSNQSIQFQQRKLMDSTFILKSIDQEHDLDQDFIMEEDHMIKNKQSNLELYLKSSAISQIRQETNVTSLVRQAQEFNECLLPIESNTFVQLPNVDNFNQIYQYNHPSQDQSKSVEEESNSINKKDEELLKVDACSISSSKNSDDLQTKKQTIIDVLNSNQTTHSILISKLITIFIILLCICYSINFGLFFNDKKEYEQNLIFYNASTQIDISFQNYIISFNNLTVQQEQITSFKIHMEQLQYTGLQSFEFQEIQLYDGFYELKYILFLMIENDTNFYEYIIDNYFKISQALQSLLKILSNLQVDKEHINQKRYIYILICTLSLLGLALIITLPTYFILAQSKLKILKFFIRLDSTSISKSQDMFNVLYDQLRSQQSRNFDYNTYTFNIKSIYKTMKNSAYLEQEKIKAIKAKSYTFENNSVVTIFVSVIIVFFFVSLSAYLIISYLLKEAMINEIDQIQLYLEDIIQINHYLINNQQFFTTLKLYPQPMYDKYFPFYNVSSINEAKYQISNLSLGSLSKNISIILEENACFNFQENEYLNKKCNSLDMNYGLIQLVIGYMNQQDIFISQIERVDSFEKFNDLTQNNNIIDQINDQIIITNLIMNNLSVNLQEQIIQKFINQVLIEIIIYILGILFIILFSLFIQKAFKQLLISQIRECQNLLRLVPFDVICNNAQIMSYVTQRARQIKE